MLTFLTIVIILGGVFTLLWLGAQRVAEHMRGNKEATDAVIEHVIIPLFGRKPEKAEPEREPPPAPVKEKEVF